MEMDNDFPYYEDMGYYEGPSNFGNVILFLLVVAALITAFFAGN